MMNRYTERVSWPDVDNSSNKFDRNNVQHNDDNEVSKKFRFSDDIPLKNDDVNETGARNILYTATSTGTSTGSTCTNDDNDNDRQLPQFGSNDDDKDRRRSISSEGGDVNNDNDDAIDTTPRAYCKIYPEDYDNNIDDYNVFESSEAQEEFIKKYCSPRLAKILYPNSSSEDDYDSNDEEFASSGALESILHRKKKMTTTMTTMKKKMMTTMRIFSTMENTHHRKMKMTTTAGKE